MFSTASDGFSIRRSKPLQIKVDSLARFAVAHNYVANNRRKDIQRGCMSEYEEQNPGWRNIGDLTEEEREFALERFIEEESLSEQALDASIRDSRLSVYLPFEELIKLDRNDPVAVQKAYVRALQIEMEQEAAKVPADGASIPIAGNLAAPSDSKLGPSQEHPRSPIGMSPVDRGASQCEHLMANNRRCGAPAMARKRYCYFHSESNSGRRTAKRLYVPVLEDQRAIQMAVTKVCQGIADSRLDPKTATSLLYGLQVASNAVPRPGSGRRK